MRQHKHTRSVSLARSTVHCVRNLTAQFASGCRQDAMLVVVLVLLQSNDSRLHICHKKIQLGLRKWSGDLGKVEAAEKK